MIKIVAPDGYKLYDRRTGKTYSEVVVNERERDRFTLVPDSSAPVVTEERR